MKLNQIIVVVLFSLLVSSCKKDPIQYSFQGIITENQNNSALSDASINMYQIIFSSSVSNSNFQLASSTTTDVNGFYSMIFERKKITELKMNILKEGYFDKDVFINVGDISSSETNIVDYQMEAKSWINFHISNIPIADNSDNFTLILYNYRNDCDDCATTDYNHFPGIVDTTFSFVSNAGEYLKFTHYRVGGTSYTDSIYLTPFDTINYSIDY